MMRRRFRMRPAVLQGLGSTPPGRNRTAPLRVPALAAVPIALLALTLLLTGCGADEPTVGPGVTTVDGAANDAGGVTDSGVTDGGADTGNADGASDGGVALDGASDDVTAACRADQCTIDSVCVDNGHSNAKNGCQVCLVVVDKTAWSADDAATCDDGNQCSSSDHCVGGSCLGTAQGCDDDNPCTDDGCKDDAGCTHTNNSAACVDGDVCTLNDACDAGSCKAGKARVCDDGNSCTDESCDAKKGCAHAANTLTCDDKNPCSLGETCGGGSCGGGAAKSCDDDDVCTVDSCDRKLGCQHESISGLCKDDNVCTDDSCDKKKGCIYGFNSDPCDDGSKCSAADTCTKGACKGTAVPTDDNNPCTTDGCDPAKGVSHEPNTLPCEDGSKCSLGDTCAASTCVSGTGKPDCDDKNGCTTDACDPKVGCVNQNHTKPCDDGTACTKDDVCGAGKCAGVAITCDDGNACTIDACDKVKGCTFTLKGTTTCRPNIEITFPPRGATIKQPTDFIEVTGKVTSGAGKITAFTVNGSKVNLAANGTFKRLILAKPGGNTLRFAATDVLGTERNRVQAFLWSSNFRKPIQSKKMSGATDPGLAYYLSKKAIDDGDHSLPPNDLATIFELFLQNYDLSGVIPNPVYQSGNTTVSISDLKYGKATVSMWPTTGALALQATIPNLTADLAAVQKVFGINLKFKGTLSITSIVITAEVVPTVVNHKLVVVMKNTKATINGFEIKLTGLGALLNGIIGALKNTFVKQFENSISDALGKQLGPVVGDALGALAFAFAFEVAALDGSGKKIKADVVTDFSKVTIDKAGATFWLRAGAYAKKGNTIDNLGVPDRIGCGSGVQKVEVLKKRDLELVLSDDTLNQILYGLWLGGLLEFPVPESMLGGVDLTKYGVKDLKMKATALLAPTVSDCNDKGELLVHIGDMRIDASLELLGQKMDVVLWATFEAGLKVSVEKNAKGGSAVGIQITEIKKIDTDITVKQENLVGSEKVIQSLVGDALVKGLIGVLGGNALGSFDLPVIDLSGTVKGLPPGAGIAIDPQSVDRKGGNTIIGGKLK